MALRILLADDSMTAQNMGKKILTDAGFDVVTVSNGAAAVKKIAEAAPDIAILDVYMPGYTGLEVCERIKGSPHTARVPVLLSVGKMEPFRPEDGMKVRADGVIIKPFEATDLVTVIKKLADRNYGVASEVSQEQEEAAAETPEGQAAGLQTFAPPEDVTNEIAPEPGVEFTSQAAVAVASAPVEDLVPTVLQEASADVPEVAAPIVESALEAPQAQVVSYAGMGAAAVAPAPIVEEEPGDEASVEEFAASVEEPIRQQPAFEQPAAIQVVEEEISADELGSMEDALASAAAMSDPTEPVETLSASEDVAVADDEGAPAFTVEEEAASPFVLQEEPANPFVVQEEEIAAPFVVEEDAAVAPPVDWTAVEADIADDTDLNLEAEMQGIVSPEETVAQPVAPRVEPAVPLVAPLGRTSYDELESMIEEAAAQPETRALGVAQEDAPLVITEEPVEQNAAFSSNEVEGLILADELPGETSEELLSNDTAPLDSEVPVLGDAAPDVIDTADSPLAEVDLNSMPQDGEELLQLPDESVVQELGSAQAVEASAPDASVSALSFYGLDGLEDESLNNPVESPDDEPLFAVMDEVAVAPGQMGEEIPAEETMLSEVVPAEEGELVLDEPASEDVLNSGSQLDEVAPMQEVTAEPTLGNEDDILAEMPSVIEEPLLSPEPEPAVAVASAATPVQATVVPAAINEEVVTAMVGRVVDRVVDRLKPILTVMVEEILAEVKKK